MLGRGTMYLLILVEPGDDENLTHAFLRAACSVRHTMRTMQLSAPLVYISLRGGLTVGSRGSTRARSLQRLRLMNGVD